MRIDKRYFEIQLLACEYALENATLPDEEALEIEMLKQQTEGKLKEMELSGQKWLYCYGRPVM